MNIILIMTSLLNMTESGCADHLEQKWNQEEQASSSGLPRRRRKQSPPIWEQLMKKKSLEVTPSPGVAIKQLQHAQVLMACALQLLYCYSRIHV